VGQGVSVKAVTQDETFLTKGLKRKQYLLMLTNTSESIHLELLFARRKVPQGHMYHAGGNSYSSIMLTDEHYKGMPFRHHAQCFVSFDPEAMLKELKKIITLEYYEDRSNIRSGSNNIRA
jgi:hypothetical protein